LGMEPGILLNKALINVLALKNPQSIREMEEIPGLKKWLRDHFGREILTAQTRGTQAGWEMAQNEGDVGSKTT
jgi:hypothetical protein